MKYIKSFNLFENILNLNDVSDIIDDILLPLKDIGMECDYGGHNERIDIFIKMPYNNNYNGLRPYFYMTEIEDVVNQLILNIENYNFKLTKAKYLTWDNRHSFDGNSYWEILYDGYRISKEIFSNKNVNFNTLKICYFKITFKNV